MASESSGEPSLTSTTSTSPVTSAAALSERSTKASRYGAEQYSVPTIESMVRPGRLHVGERVGPGAEQQVEDRHPVLERRRALRVFRITVVIGEYDLHAGACEQLHVEVGARRGARQIDLGAGGLADAEQSLVSALMARVLARPAQRCTDIERIAHNLDQAAVDAAQRTLAGEPGIGVADRRRELGEVRCARVGMVQRPPVP